VSVVGTADFSLCGIVVLCLVYFFSIFFGAPFHTCSISVVYLFAIVPWVISWYCDRGVY